MEREHVGVALDQDHAADAGRGGASAIEAEQHPALVVQLAVGGVQVLGTLVVAHRARAEPDHVSAGVGGREHDPLAEPVVDLARTVLGALREPHGQQLLVAETGAARGGEDPVPGTRRIADPEGLKRLLAKPTPEQVFPRRQRLPCLPQIARVVGRSPRQERLEALAALTALRRLRVLVLGLELDSKAVGERLERSREVEPLGLHHEREHVARGLAAEAVVDLLDRVDAERRGPLVVERAASDVLARAGAAQLGVVGDHRDHVDRVADAISRVGGESAHGANATGTLSASNVRMQNRSVMPARWSVTRRGTSPERDRVGDLVRVRAVVIEQRAHDHPDLGVLARRLGAQVDPLEHERPQLGHRRADRLALRDVALLLRALDEIVDERVDPPGAGVAEDLDRPLR